MVKKGVHFIAVVLAAGLVLMSSLPATAADAGKPKIAPICKQCHQPDEKVLRGMIANVSMKASTIQVNIGPAAWLVKFDDNTKLTGAEALNKIPKEKEISIAFVEKDGQLYATAVGVKPPARVPEEKLMKVDELAKLVATGPEEGKFFLVDSRPAPRFGEGHIPGAINIYDAEFDKNVEKLPADKDILLVFYCAGVT